MSTTRTRRYWALLAALPAAVFAAHRTPASCEYLLRPASHRVICKDSDPLIGWPSGACG